MQELQETQVRSLGQEDLPGEGHGNPLHYSCLGNPMDRGAWWATVHRVANSHVTDMTETTLQACIKGTISVSPKGSYFTARTNIVHTSSV